MSIRVKSATRREGQNRSENEYRLRCAVDATEYLTEEIIVLLGLIHDAYFSENAPVPLSSNLIGKLENRTLRWIDANAPLKVMNGTLLERVYEIQDEVKKAIDFVDQNKSNLQ